MRWSNTCFQRAVGGGVGAGALVRDAALGHHHQLVGLQRHRDFVQHADHGVAAAPPARAPVSSQSAWCGGSRLASGSSISSTCGLAPPARAPAARAGARRPRAGPAARSRQSQAWVARRACSTAAWSAALGARQPGLVRQAAQHGHVLHRQVVGRAFVLAQPGQLLRPLAPAAGWPAAGPAACTSPLCGSSPASTLSRVDLPAPLGPTMLVQRPARQGQVNAVQHLGISEAGAYANGR